MNVVKEFNKEYAAVLMGGKFRIYDGNNFLTAADFHNLLAGRIVVVEDKKIAMSQIWMHSPKRRTYQDVVFEPGQEDSPDILNLYEGLAVEPVKGHWSLLEDHIFENICNGRKDYFEWLIQWMAQIVQEPSNKLGTAIVIRGDKGTGKSIFAECFGRLFGQYFRTLNSGDHVTSRFNSVYEHCLLLCADEAVWGGSKKGEGTLKGLITAPEIWVERKGYEGAYKKNFTRFIFTTNEDWAVPATEDERRYFVLQMGRGWQKNIRIFAALMQQMERGGYEAMLYDLLNVKITANLRIPPGTAGLQDQKELSEPLPIQFWRDRLSNADPELWPGEIKKETLYDKMVEYCAKRRAQYIVGDAQFFKMLRKYIQPWQEIRKIDAVNPMSGRKLYLVLPDHKTCVRLMK